MESPKGDIDLLYILSSIKNGVSDLINWTINTTIKKIVVVIIFVATGLGIGFLVFSFKKPVYISDLTIAHTRFDNDQCFELVNNLTKLNGVPDQTSKVLNISSEMANEIKGIFYQPINPRTTKLYNDSALVIIPFKISVEVYTPGVLDTLQQKLMNYLESNDYGVKRKMLKKAYLEQYEQKIKNEILAIDTLKNIVNQSIKHKNQGNGVLIDEPIDPVKISQRSVELINAELKIKEQQQLNNSFELMVGFNGGVRKTANLMLSMFYGFLVGYLFALIWIYRREKKAN